MNFRIHTFVQTTFKHLAFERTTCFLNTRHVTDNWIKKIYIYLVARSLMLFLATVNRLQKKKSEIDS